MKYVFPHLCPSSSNGEIPGVDDLQTEQFLSRLSDFDVMPWVGGVFGSNAVVDSRDWRKAFVTSILRLLENHRRFKGVHLNVEPLPSNNVEFIELIKELRAALPEEKWISIAAYPPPTYWQTSTYVHWDESYFKKVAGLADQMVPMMYDTAIPFNKPYQSLMADWTKQVLEWSGKTQVLLGIPAYEDAGVGYHDPAVENLKNSITGIHRGLLSFSTIPTNYAGVAIYSEWVMTPEKWLDYENGFSKVVE